MQEKRMKKQWFGRQKCFIFGEFSLVFTLLRFHIFYSGVYANFGCFFRYFFAVYNY